MQSEAGRERASIQRDHRSLQIVLPATHMSLKVREMANDYLHRHGTTKDARHAGFEYFLSCLHRSPGLSLSGRARVTVVGE
jgi:hypothetical protein